MTIIQEYLCQPIKSQNTLIKKLTDALEGTGTVDIEGDQDYSESSISQEDVIAAIKTYIEDILHDLNKKQQQELNQLDFSYTPSLVVTFLENSLKNTPFITNQEVKRFINSSTQQLPTNPDAINSPLPTHSSFVSFSSSSERATSHNSLLDWNSELESNEGRELYDIPDIETIFIKKFSSCVFNDSYGRQSQPQFEKAGASEYYYNMTVNRAMIDQLSHATTNEKNTLKELFPDGKVIEIMNTSQCEPEIPGHKTVDNSDVQEVFEELRNERTIRPSY